jgi:hypothetical protein
MWGCLWDP